MRTFHTEDECKCGGLIDHVYHCTCDDYWGYCTDTSHNWFECIKCGGKVPKPEYKETRKERTDPGTPEERQALNKLLGLYLKEEELPLNATSSLDTIDE